MQINEGRELTESEASVVRTLKELFYKLEGNAYEVQACDSEYQKVTGIDLGTLNLVYGIGNVLPYFKYVKAEDGIVLEYNTTVNRIRSDNLSGYFTCKEDFLHFFDSAPADDSIENWWKTADYDTIKSAVVGFLKLRSTEELTDIMNEASEDFTAKVVEDWHKNADFDSVDSVVTDEIKETIALNWIEDNPSGACSHAEYYLGTSDTKDVIKSFVDNL